MVQTSVNDSDTPSHCRMGIPRHRHAMPCYLFFLTPQAPASFFFFLLTCPFRHAPRRKDKAHAATGRARTLRSLDGIPLASHARYLRVLRPCSPATGTLPSSTLSYRLQSCAPTRTGGVVQAFDWAWSWASARVQVAGAATRRPFSLHRAKTGLIVISCAAHFISLLKRTFCVALLPCDVVASALQVRCAAAVRVCAGKEHAQGTRHSLTSLAPIHWKFIFPPP